MQLDFQIRLKSSGTTTGYHTPEIRGHKDYDSKFRQAVEAAEGEGIVEFSNRGQTSRFATATPTSTAGYRVGVLPDLCANLPRDVQLGRAPPGWTAVSPTRAPTNAPDTDANDAPSDANALQPTEDTNLYGDARDRDVADGLPLDPDWGLQTPRVQRGYGMLGIIERCVDDKSALTFFKSLFQVDEQTRG